MSNRFSVYMGKAQFLKAKLFEKGDEDGFGHSGTEMSGTPYVESIQSKHFGLFGKSYLIIDGSGNKSLQSKEFFEENFLKCIDEELYRPVMKQNPDLSELKRAAQEYIDYIGTDNYNKDKADGLAQIIQVRALLALYGDDIYVKHITRNMK